MLAARPSGPIDQVRVFHLLHAGWRVASFRLFRPLAYFAAFSAPEIFECLRLAVSSLIEHGKWRWDVLVLTAPETSAIARAMLEPCALGERLHVATITPAETMRETGASPGISWTHTRCSRAPQMPLSLSGCVDILCEQAAGTVAGATRTVPDHSHACAEGRLGEEHP